MIYDEDPYTGVDRGNPQRGKRTGGVFLDGGKSGQMALETRAYPQNQTIGWLRKECSSL